MGLWHVVTTWRISKYRSPPPKVIDGFYMFLRPGPWLLLVNPVQNDPNIAGGHQNGGLVGHPLLPFYLHQVHPMNSHCTLLPWKIHPKKPQKPYNKQLHTYPRHYPFSTHRSSPWPGRRKPTKSSTENWRNSGPWRRQNLGPKNAASASRDERRTFDVFFCQETVGDISP